MCPEGRIEHHVSKTRMDKREYVRLKNRQVEMSDSEY